jgi:hypothetical protein
MPRVSEIYAVAYIPYYCETGLMRDQPLLWDQLWKTNLLWDHSCERTTSFVRPTSSEITLVRGQPFLWDHSSKIPISCETTVMRDQPFLWDHSCEIPTSFVRSLLWKTSLLWNTTFVRPLLWDQFTKSQPLLILVIHAVNVYKLPWELLTLLNRPHLVGRRDEDLWHLPLWYACISYM